MKLLVTNFKGGVGKSSIAQNLAQYFKAQLVTNDIISNNTMAHQIAPSKKRIPFPLTKLKDVVFDFGAMSTNLDPKIAQAVKLVDGIVIPTLTDERSLKATIETYQLVKPSGKPIIIIINHFTDQKKADKAVELLNRELDNVNYLFIRSTTLFERVARDGLAWFSQIGHAKGEYQLSKTKQQHELVYEQILKIGGGK